MRIAARIGAASYGDASMNPDVGVGTKKAIGSGRNQARRLKTTFDMSKRQSMYTSESRGKKTDAGKGHTGISTRKTQRGNSRAKGTHVKFTAPKRSVQQGPPPRKRASRGMKKGKASV